IQFTDDITVDFLKNYLTADFKNDIISKSPEELIFLYKTHVLLDISLGGRLLFNYTANISNETTTEKKTSKVEGGLGFFVKKFGINFKTSKTTEEMKQNFNESRERQMYLKFYGGTGSGRSITYDSDGYSSETINISTWQQSINKDNCALVDIQRMVPLYEFIDNPTKKAQVKAAILKHIKDRQITELGEVPIYGYYSVSGADHYYTHENSPTIGNGTFVNEGIAFYAFKEPKQNAVPIYVYGYEKARDHYYTTQNSPTINGGNFKNEGIAFYAYSSAGERRVPIFVYYYARNTDHYYTTENSPTISGGNFKNEGIAFYGVKTN
ncbi:MAG: MAC/perforin domain-containing protein, partial [Sphingobacterium sp.]